MKNVLDPVDKHVGEQLRLLRVANGMSQGMLGEKLGISFQQVQKYERGTNRIAASRLYRLTRIFGVPPSYFFEGYGAAGDKEDDAADAGIRVGSRVELDRISDAEVRKSVRQLIRALQDPETS